MEELKILGISKEEYEKRLFDIQNEVTDEKFPEFWEDVYKGAFNGGEGFGEESIKAVREYLRLGFREGVAAGMEHCHNSLAKVIKKAEEIIG